MPKRKWACQTTEVTSPPVKRRTRGIIDSPIQEESQTDSDESHRTEQLLHRHSVTPPQKQPTHRPSTKRDSFSSASSACTTSPDLAYLGSASSEVESDVLQYSADTAVYYPGTDLVIDGWFQPCRSALAATVCNACKRNMYQAKVLCNRGCGAFTAGQVEVGSKVAPLCQRCQGKLTKAVEGILPHTYTAAPIGPVDYFYGWMSIKVPLLRQQSLIDRLQVRHDLIVKMSDHWVRCREEARAANCRVPCA